MIVRYQCFQTQKSGNYTKELEDAARPERAGESTGEVFLAAVADGASEGYLSAEWANLLVEEFCQAFQEPEEWERAEECDLTGLIRAARQKWAAFLQEYVACRQAEGRPIQWYEEPGLENGAFSTLLGLAIIEDAEREARYWFSSAVGDSCLFQVRGDQCIAAFPIQGSAGFNSWPALIPSNPAREGKLAEHIRWAYGDWQAGDGFYLMTDALSACFLAEVEAERRPWQLLEELAAGDQDGFVVWVEAMRGKDALKNDDVTLLSLVISAC